MDEWDLPTAPLPTTLKSPMTGRPMERDEWQLPSPPVDHRLLQRKCSPQLDMLLWDLPVPPTQGNLSQPMHTPSEWDLPIPPVGQMNSVPSHVTKVSLEPQSVDSVPPLSSHTDVPIRESIIHEPIPSWSSDGLEFDLPAPPEFGAPLVDVFTRQSSNVSPLELSHTPDIIMSKLTRFHCSYFTDPWALESYRR